MRKLLPYIPAENHQVDTLIGDLPRPALAPVASFFDAIAGVVKLYAQLHDIAEARERNTAKRVERLDGLGAVVAVLQNQGRSLDEIVRQFEAQGVPPETTMFYLRRHGVVQRRINRARRDREIMRLAALGWIDARIGARVGLHPGSVSRIVQRVLRETRPLAGAK